MKERKKKRKNERKSQKSGVNKNKKRQMEKQNRFHDCGTQKGKAREANVHVAKTQSKLQGLVNLRIFLKFVYGRGPYK